MEKNNLKQVFFQYIFYSIRVSKTLVLTNNVLNCMRLLKNLKLNTTRINIETEIINCTQCVRIQLVKNFYKLILKQQNTNTQIPLKTFLV